MGTSLTGASNAGGVGRNHDSEPISGFTVVNAATGYRCYKHDAVGPRHARCVTSLVFVDGGKKGEMFVTRSFNVTPKTTEQHLIARSDKSVAYVTNNKRLCSTFCTIEANYWQTQSIARPFWDSRAVCLSIPNPVFKVTLFFDAEYLINS